MPLRGRLWAVRQTGLSTSNLSSRSWLSVSYTTAASSSKNPYPFPSHPNPTPHQIFHLGPHADQDTVKSRYYELVKQYHPDTATKDGTPSSACHDRFQKIASAYNQLRKTRGRTKLAAASEAYSHAAGAPNRRWTGRRNEWGGFEYEYDHEFREKGKDGRPSAAKPASPQYEKTFNQSDAPYWIFAGCALLCGLAQFVYFSPAAEAAKHNRRAIQSLDSARRSRDEHGAQRREDLKRWADERRQRESLESLEEPIEEPTTDTQSQ